MVIVILSLILIYAIDTFLVGISFYALKSRFQWHISNRMSLVILFLVFAFLDNYLLPMFIVLNVSFTIGNPEIAELFDLKPNISALEFFGFGFFEFISWIIQSFLAAIIGEKIIIGKTKSAV